MHNSVFQYAELATCARYGLFQGFNRKWHYVMSCKCEFHLKDKLSLKSSLLDSYLRFHRQGLSLGPD